MQLNKAILAFLLLLFLAIAGNLNATEKLSVAFAEVLAPWVLTENNEGIIVDIFESAVEPLGFEVEHVYLPYARRLSAYKNGIVDVVSDINPNTIQGHALEGYFSDIAYSYENFAFSLHKRNLHLDHINQLTKYSLLSWQDAAIHLGDEYAEMVSKHPQYSETFDQYNQVKMLFLERYDVVQMDAQIFAYYRNKLATFKEVDTSQKVDRFALFGASPNGFLFRSKKLRDDFNLQLKRLKQNGDYAKIFEKYASAASNGLAGN